MTQPDVAPTTPAPPPFFPPDPLEVVIKGRTDPVAYACPKCGMLQILAKDDDDEEKARKRDEAAAHCMKVCVCGNKLDYHYFLRCKECRDKADHEKERKRFEKAEKLSLEAYADDPVFWEGHVGRYGEGYFSGVDEVLDYCETEGFEVPEYVWACTATDFSLDAANIIESELESQEMYEDAADNVSEEARKRLQAYLDVWTKEVGIRSWNTDYSRAILLREEPVAA
jgi:hypothetical protein